MQPNKAFKKSKIATALFNSFVCMGAMQNTSKAATLVVNSNADSFGAGCELREAIGSINAGGNLFGCFNIAPNQNFGIADQIIVDTNNLASSTVTLQQSELTIEKNVIISGLGLTIDADQKSRVFYTDAFAVSLNDLTISNGSSSLRGGGINGNNSGISINNCIISGNTSDYDGGGIFVTSVV